MNMKDIAIAGYEKIKSELISRGYTLNEDTYTKEIVKNHQMMVNGQAFNQEERMRIDIIYMGEGYEENKDGSNHKIIHYFNINLNDQPSGGIGVESWDDLITMIKV